MTNLLNMLSAAELNAIELLLGTSKRQRADNDAEYTISVVTVDNLLRSATARDRGIINSPTSQQTRDNLARLAEFLTLAKFSVGDLVITSGYRSKLLNQAVGGSPRSIHMQGRAADVRHPDLSNKDLAALLLEIGADKVIVENLSKRGWVHVEIPKQGKQPRGRAVTANRHNGRIRYTAGIA